MANTIVVKQEELHFPDTCPCCGSDSIKTFGQLKSGAKVNFGPNIVALPEVPELCGCKNCKSWFSRGTVSENTARLLYTESSELRWDGGEFSKSKPRKLVGLFESHLKPGMSVLDIGCNHGLFLDYAKSLGCETSGVEWNNSSRKLSQDKGHSMYRDIHDVKTRFDIVTGFDIIEHLYDIPSFMASVQNLVVPGGYVMFFTGNIDCIWARILKHKWWYVQFPEHIVFPSETFFKSWTPFRHVVSIRTGHAKMSLDSVRTFLTLIKLVAMGRFNSLRPLLSDHALYVLKNNV